jgi:hypothetical protein
VRSAGRHVRTQRGDTFLQDLVDAHPRIERCKRILEHDLRRAPGVRNASPFNCSIGCPSSCAEPLMVATLRRSCSTALPTVVLPLPDHRRAPAFAPPYAEGNAVDRLHDADGALQQPLRIGNQTR